MKRQLTEITRSSPKIHQPVTFAVVADLHNAPYEDVIPALQGADAILILGDLVNRHREGYTHAARFLQEAPTWAPTYYSIGNHERKFQQLSDYWPLVEASGVTVLDDAFCAVGEVILGGFSSIYPSDERGIGAFHGRGLTPPAFLQEMVRQPGFRLLMCHHPEYYPLFLRELDLDLTLAGHAHGGQIRIAGQGLYAPGQGLLPRLTSGWYERDRLFVSRGMTNSARAPRLWNPCELVLLHLIPDGEGKGD